jgi:ubiquinone/menaquinone biosynthesis C-methylase UbiE
MANRLADQYADDTLLQARQDMHERFSEFRSDVRSWVTDRIPFAAGARLLDVGCGNGRYFPYYAARGASVVAMDPFPGMLKAAARAGNADLVAAAAGSLPFADASFGVVCINHVLGFVPDRPRALREAHRVLRPGGTVAVTLNTRDHSRELYAVWNQAVGETGRHPVAAATTASYRAEDAEIQVAEVFGSAVSDRLENAFVFATPDDPVAYLATTHFAEEEDPPLAPDEVVVVNGAVRAHATKMISARGVWRVPKPVMVITATK